MEITNSSNQHIVSNRRAFLKQGMLWMASSAASLSSMAAEPTTQNPVMQIGLITDVHYADKTPADTRHYRDSMAKIRRSISEFNRVPVDFAAELGDYVDAAETVEAEIGYLKTIDAELQKFAGARHYVLGNHCVWSLTKTQFLETVRQTNSFYSFDHNDFHFIVLDACFRGDEVAYGEKNYEWTDTEIPVAEREWLADDLQKTKHKSIVFLHQRLDIEGHYTVKSAPAVRRILEQSGKVLAVFQGHYHQNDYQEINGIHYCTLAAMIEGAGTENDAYSILKIFVDGAMQLVGFGNQTDYALSS
ncbi:MAG: alkaline phosphatase [Candidatus Omnitrophota bacterium]|jgi:alkaline phosphatase|nr:MAG: alkaline phosphatase [Candidatus Omnitrophota bacterium]